MKHTGKTTLALLLCLLLFLSLFPAAYADGDGAGTLSPAETAEEEGTIALVPEASEDPAFASPAPEDDDPEETEPVRLAFACDPEDTRVTVFDPACPDPGGEPLSVLPEEDGTYLLPPGTYLFSAVCPGCEPVEKTPFVLEPGAGRVIRLSMVPEPLIPMTRRGELPLYETAYPLPALTGDQAYDTANIARSQLGYTMSDGTVYGAWWTGVTNWGLDYTYLDWCAMFACWCADQAGAGLNVAYNKNGASCRLLLEWQQSHASADTDCATTPRTGDFLYFAGSDGLASHTAIVTSYDAAGNTVYFIGGNQGSPAAVRPGSVAWEKGAYFGAKTLLGYGRPNYSILVQEEGLPRIERDPSSVTANVGALVRFTVKASGQDLRYQWQWRSGPGGSWKNSTGSGSTAATLSVSAETYRSGYEYRCKVSNSVGSTVSTAAVLTVIDRPVITVQPRDLTASTGTTARFSVAATGSNLRYQWQWRSGPEGSWKNSTVAGSTTASLAVSAQSFRSGYQYRCYISNGKSSVMSLAATLTVTDKPVITLQPKDTTVGVGGLAGFHVTATGSDLHYQWQWSPDNGKTWKSCTAKDAATRSLSVSAAAYRDGYRYRCVVSNSKGSTASDPAVLKVSDLPVVTSQPKSQSVKAGETASFTAAASGSGLSWRWQWRSCSSGAWADSTVSGCDTACLSISAVPARSGYQYRCIITNANGSVYTSVATLTVK